MPGGGAVLVDRRRRHPALLEQGFVTLEVGVRLGRRGVGVGDLRLGEADVAPRRGLLLFVVGEVGLLGRQIGLRLLQTLAIDAIVDLHQQLAGFDPLVVLYRHGGDVAVELGRDHGDEAAHIGVVGRLDGAGEGGQPPGIEHQQHPCGPDQEQGDGRARPQRRAQGLVRDGRFGHRARASSACTRRSRSSTRASQAKIASDISMINRKRSL